MLQAAELMVGCIKRYLHVCKYQCYLGSMLQKDGNIDANVCHRIKAGWMKWHQALSFSVTRGYHKSLKASFIEWRLATEYFGNAYVAQDLWSHKDGLSLE